MRKAKAEKRKKKEREEEEGEDEGNITIPFSTSNKKKKEKEKKQYEENIVVVEPNSHKVKKKKKTNKVSEDVISWKEEGEEEEEEVLDYLPGQKHDRPGKRDPLRIFYETLYQKAPDCELAETWMMEWGLLPPIAAEKVYETKFGHNQQMSPEAIKAASTSEVPKNRKESKRLSNPASKTKKRKSSETNSVDDFRPPKKKIKKQVSST